MPYTTYIDYHGAREPPCNCPVCPFVKTAMSVPVPTGWDLVRVSISLR